MADLTCPYCYHSQHRDALRFVCDGQGSPGMRGCRPLVDEVRMELTGYGGESMPTFVAGELDGRRGRCPSDGSWSGQRACANCRTPLPSGLLDGLSPLIGMVGGRAAGKTIYLSVLYRQLRNSVSKRFRADVHLVGSQQAGGNSILEWLRDYEHQLFDDHQLPARTETAVYGRRVPLVLEWRHNQGTEKRPRFVRTVLSFCDAAGEDILNQERPDRQRYLRASDGLIVLLDAYQIPGVRSQVELPEDAESPLALVDGVLGVVTEAIRGSGEHGDRITTPVAVVVAKLDVVEPLLPRGHFLMQAAPEEDRGYDEHFGSDMHQHVRSLLVNHGAEDVDLHMRTNYEHYRYFAASALGALPDYVAKEVNERGVQPKHVVEPLLWLMRKQGIIKQVGRA